jgi:cation:H+ antiporter
MIDDTTAAALFWIVVMLSGFALAVVGSRRALRHATALSAGTRLPPFVIGITLLAIGTDLPEIANSIVASATGHGDINVGDSVGSAATQSTLVLGLLPLLGGAFVTGRRQVVGIGGVMVGALVLGAILMSDGDVSRMDALILIAGFLLGTAFTWLNVPSSPASAEVALEINRWQTAGRALAALVFVALGAMAAVWAVTNLAKRLDVSEYILAFFVASLGTSLPELVVTGTAIRQGRTQLAIGDALGSSFVDSTLSIAAGPLLFPVAVTSSLAVRGSIAAAIAIALVVVVMATRKKHDVPSALILLALYLAFYVAIIGA